MSDHDVPIAHHDPSEGFDPGEPAVKSIWGFAVGSIIVLLITIVALQHYFEKIWNDAVYEKVLVAPSEQLQEVRGRDDWDLTHSMYLNKDTGQVRIPLEHAQELFLQEAAAGKPFYPGKPAAPKKDDMDGWQGLQADTAGAAAPAPATGAPGTPAASAPGTPAAPAPAAAEKK